MIRPTLKNPGEELSSEGGESKEEVLEGNCQGELGL